LPPQVNVPQVCQATLEYDCSVFPQFLDGQPS
jgi:hypothetical protein